MMLISKAKISHLSFFIVFFALSIPVFVFSLSVITHAQIRGKLLFEKLRNDKSLVKFEGIRSVKWAPDGSSYYSYDSNAGTFMKTYPETGKENPLFDDAEIIAAYNRAAGKNSDKLPFKEFSSVDEGRKIRFQVGNYIFIYDFPTKEMISFLPEQNIKGVRGNRYREVFSQNYKYRAYIREYNLYYKDIEGNEVPVTTDGFEDLRNGFPDWVYPEEFGQHDAFWWSPDSRRIAYMQFDERPVRKYPIVHDILPVPKYELQSYPKAGENNPIINFFVYDLDTQKTIRVKTGQETNVYLIKGQWTPDGKEFTYQRVNRRQNKVELFAADPNTGKTRFILCDEDPCYVEIKDNPIFLKKTGQFLWMSERSGWNEIYLYDMSGKLIKQITKNNLALLRIRAVDEENGWTYVNGLENRGMEIHFYRVRLDGTQFSKLTEESGSHYVDVAPWGRYYVDSFSSFQEPGKVTLHRGDGSLIRDIGYSSITQELKDLKLIKPEYFVFKSSDGKYDLDGMLYKPAHFDETKKYPLVFSVYGGPGSKMIFSDYSSCRRQSLSQLGFIVAYIDHRGVSGRGKAFKNLMYMNLGKIELEDHVAAARHLAERPYIDGNRVGIMGHSYGGYLTCMALLKAPDIFHVGVASAPVTDWRNYDTIYTERYMRRPQDNLEGYDRASCLKYAQNLRGHLAIHQGAVDDNVHPGNTIQLVYELLKHDKKFDLVIYPEQTHMIRFPRYRDAIREFLIEHLQPEIIDE